MLNGPLVRQVVQNVGRKRAKGETFKIITDLKQTKSKSMQKYVQSLSDAGAEVKLNSNSGISMHSKFIIIDNQIVLHGSMNLGKQSLRNNEQFEITFDKDVIKQFRLRFDKMWTNKKSQLVDYNPFTF